MAIRYGGAVVLGGIVTFALLMVMRGVIANPEAKVEGVSEGHIVELVQVQEDRDVVVETKLPEPPPPPDEPPPDLPPQAIDSVESIGIDVGAVPVDTKFDIGGGGGFATDGEYLPIIKVQPVYPRRALQRGIEGHVKLRFTVTETGSVIDPVVVAADPQNIFDRAAIQAALKFKYKPRMVDGKPVAVGGVENIIRFKLDDG